MSNFIKRNWQTSIKFRDICQYVDAFTMDENYFHTDFGNKKVDIYCNHIAAFDICFFQLVQFSADYIGILNFILKLFIIWKFWLRDTKRKRKRSDSVLWQKPLHPQKSKSNGTTQNDTKNLDYTTIAERFRTVSSSNNSNPTGVIKLVYERSTSPLTATAVWSIGNTFKNL